MKNCKIAAILLVMLLLVSSFSAVISAETTGTANFTAAVPRRKPEKPFPFLFPLQIAGCQVNEGCSYL